MNGGEEEEDDHGVSCEKAAVWGQMIKINKLDGTQVIELQRAQGKSWGFFVARGSIDDVKGKFSLHLLYIHLYFSLEKLQKSNLNLILLLPLFVTLNKTKQQQASLYLEYTIMFQATR